MSLNIRVGLGYDVHRLVKDRPLILGGVEIPWERGLLGHSDADVLLHAVMDALLGAAGLGDIGRLFPDSDPQYKGISSLILLERTVQKLKREGYQPINVDATVVAEQPKLAPYLPEMRDKIARCLGLQEDAVNIKATTEEGLGFTGSGAGIAAQAIALVELHTGWV